jgi:hypothetical protein
MSLLLLYARQGIYITRGDRPGTVKVNGQLTPEERGEICELKKHLMGELLRESFSPDLTHASLEAAQAVLYAYVLGDLEADTAITLSAAIDDARRQTPDRLRAAIVRAHRAVHGVVSCWQTV